MYTCMASFELSLQSLVFFLNKYCQGNMPAFTGMGHLTDNANEQPQNYSIEQQCAPKMQ